MFSLVKIHVVLLAKSHPHKKLWMDCLLQLLDNHLEENSQMVHPLYCYKLPSQVYQLPFKKWIRQMLITLHQVPKKFIFRSPHMKNFVVDSFTTPYGTIPAGFNGVERKKCKLSYFEKYTS